MMSSLVGSPSGFSIMTSQCSKSQPKSRFGQSGLGSSRDEGVDLVAKERAAGGAAATGRRNSADAAERGRGYGGGGGREGGDGEARRPERRRRRDRERREVRGLPRLGEDGDSLAVPVARVARGYGGLAILVEITQDGTTTLMFRDYGSSEETVRNDGDRREEMMKQVRPVRWRR
ncbi:hypothetical protein NL676_028552 [Syzygium grande]|nr:hypothetical protein NL676_028552 [Syzygium grande]